MKKEGRKNTKCMAYVAAFIVFQTIIILVFAPTLLKIKSPKLRFGKVDVESFSNSTSSFTMKLQAQVAVKNTNFGHFKYPNNTIPITYGGVTVGEVVVPKGRARARSTNRFTVAVELSFDQLSSNSTLGNDITSGSGLLPLVSQAKLPGKIHLMKVMKKKKTAEMYCTIKVNLMNCVVQDLKCK
ncbi:hypothetical protein PVL29_001555 [Vitis rotundifolia]|uniref:Late embryogenesis abundant protein LEA-2 subgroup domain-containing protein n=1 Tax=Vitis rotundifolia TaxID=103349 RepID=A0AA39E2N1_VITRO|nr:hypothetical protein PVL29_001555 [Vitis rotundifolia]